MRDALADLANRLFQPDAGVTLSGQPVRNFLAGPAPANPLSRLQYDMGRSACNSWARGDGSGIPPARELFMRDTCEPYISSVGTLPASGTLAPAWTGGMCAGTNYRVTYQATYVDYLDGNEEGVGSHAPITITSFNFPGPIEYARFEPDTFGTTGLPQSWRIAVKATGVNERRYDSRPTDRPPLGGRTERRLQAGSISFARFSGGADTCGNPPSGWNAGNPGQGIPGPSPIPSPPGFGLPFPDLSIRLNPDGTITIDTGDDTPDVTVDPGAPGGDGGGTPAGPPTAGTPGDTGPGGEDDGEAPPGQELWALRIDLLAIPADANEYAPGVYRGVCYVYMGDANGLDHDPAGAMLRNGQLVLAERDGLDRYAVRANSGYNLRVTPYWRTPEEP